MIVSSISEDRTVELVRRLEDFRGAVELLTKIGTFDERIPTRLYILPRGSLAFGLGDGFSGYFMPRMRANYAAVIPQPGGGIDDVIKHEYVHFLLHNDGARNYPRWLDEGFAQLFQTLEVIGKTIQFGNAPSHALNNLHYASWLPYERVLRAYDTFQLGSRATMFYAQSWLLVHYLQAGRKGHSFADESNEYIAALEAGADPTAAFESTFDMRVAELRGTLRQYAEKDVLSFVFTLKQPFGPSPITVARITPSSISTQLADLLIARGASDAAESYIDAAIAFDPHNGAALVAQANVRRNAGRFDEAQPYYEKAIALEPKNAYHQLDYGKFFLAKATASQDAATIASDLIEARRHFARSDALDPTVPETLAMNGATYLFPGQSIDKGIASLVAAQEMLPSQPEIAALLAAAYARGNQKDKAIKLLRASLAMRDADDVETQNARKLLEEWAADGGDDTPKTESAEADDTTAE